MLTTHARSLGGKALAAKIRAAYVANPNRCLECRTPILPTEGRKLTEVKDKKYCSMRCAGLHRVRLGTNALRPHARRPARACETCSGDLRRLSKRRVCESCRQRVSGARTKADSGTRIIHDHAHQVVRGRARSCVHCGYPRHAEVCHIRPIASFPGDATLAEINAPNNLAMLCPNCHWELDHGMLDASALPR